MFTLTISFWSTSNLPCHGPKIPGSYAIWFFTASDFTSIISHIQNCVLFLLWLCIFILSGVVSLLFSSSILGTCWPEEFIFQCPLFLPFHTAHGGLKASILKWFAIAFASGPCFVRTLHLDSSILGIVLLTILPIHLTNQDDGVEGCVLFFCENSKITLISEQMSTEEWWIPSKRDTLHPRAKEKP